MVVSSYGKDQGATRPGYEFDEFSQAYLIFKANGMEVDIASPKGGKVEADKFNTDKEYNKALMADEAVLGLLDNTLPTSEIVSENYDAIYIVGGKGAMFDLPFDPSLQDIVLDLYKREGTVISSVCHGPAALVNIKDGDQYIIEGQEITSFCNTEEELFGKKWVPEFPFALEDKLKARGAKFSQADFMLANVAVSGKFVTGQNPFSTTGSAEAVVKALGQEPVQRELYKDEASIYLIQDVLDQSKSKEWAIAQLAQHTEDYEIQLIAVWGYYKLLSAGEDQEAINQGISLIELSQPHFFNERLQLQLAKSYTTLNQTEKAREVLNDLISKELLVKEAEGMLAEME